MRHLTAILLLLAQGAAAQEPPGAAAAAAAARLETAATQLAQASGARDRVQALTDTVQAYEDGLIAMREGLRRAAIAEAQMQAQLDSRSAEVGQLLGVLQSMGRAPAPLLLLHPNGPVGTAQGGMILADVTPALQAKVDTLRGDLADIRNLQILQESAADTLAEGLQGAQEARTALSAAISERTDLPERFTENPVQTALLIASTETLDGFASGLAEAFLNNEGAPDTPLEKGNLPLPVQGTVLRDYNAPDAAGIARPGIIVAARPRALVTTPVAATLLFHGELLDYGTVVILEPAADVLFVMAGLTEVYGAPGQVLPAGSPIGVLGGDQPDADSILIESERGSTGAATETLYLEVRDGQSPVNPGDWFAVE